MMPRLHILKARRLHGMPSRLLSDIIEYRRFTPDDALMQIFLAFQYIRHNLSNVNTIHMPRCKNKATLRAYFAIIRTLTRQRT